MGAETRERILDAGAELLRRQGYAGTAVKEIVAEASAPFGSLYHFFPGGKEELGVEVVLRSGRLYGRLLAEVAGPQPDVVSGIDAFFREAAVTVEESDYADACPIATVALEVSSTSEPLRRACAQVFEEWMAGLTAYLQTGGVEPDAARALAVQILSLLEGAFVFCRALRTTQPLEDARTAAVAAVRTALRVSQ